MRIGARYAGRTAELKAGNFLVPAGASMAGIVDIVAGDGRSTCGTEIVYRIGVGGAGGLVRELDPAANRYVEIAEFDPLASPRPAEVAAARAEAGTRYRITVAEGVTSWSLAEQLGAVDILSGDVASVPPEGLLAPDSYEIRPGDSRGGLLARMEERQSGWLDEAWRNRAADLPYESPGEALVMASIIEKETGVAEERGIVASVFVNRLKRGMRLQSDPTVIYGVTGGKAILDRGLRRSELDRETPYNTYLVDGLPPTPIANPGKASIEAALDPADTPYLYFVADGTGGHAFAETLDEHNRNVARWRAIEASRGNE